LTNEQMDRLYDEHDEITQRVDKLSDFISSPKFESLAAIDRTDLREQLDCMDKYRNVLMRRVSRSCSNA